MGVALKTINACLQVIEEKLGLIKLNEWRNPEYSPERSRFKNKFYSNKKHAIMNRSQ